MRAIKTMSSVLLCLMIFPSFANQTLTCISNNNAFQRCALSQADQRDIRIQSVKSGSCDTDNSWGVDSSGIWVNKGCGAVFEYTQVAGASSSNNAQNSNNNDNGPDVIISPGFVGPYYGPGFYYGAGYYENNGWNNDDYCHNNNCNHQQQHNYNHEQEHQNFENREGAEGFHGGGGGFHGGGGRR